MLKKQVDSTKRDLSTLAEAFEQPHAYARIIGQLLYVFGPEGKFSLEVMYMFGCSSYVLLCLVFEQWEA